jgi:hypothetical protein
MDDGSVTTLTNPVTGSGTTNYLSKWTSGSVIGNSLIFDNGTNLGIGTNSPNTSLHIVAGAGLSSRLKLQSDGTAASMVDFNNGSTSRWTIGVDNNQTYGKLENRVAATDAIRFYDASNNVVLNVAAGNTLIGTATDVGYKLYVRGNFYVNTNAVGTLCNITDGIYQTFQINTTASGFDITNPNSGYISFSNTAERMRITGAGNFDYGGYNVQSSNNATYKQAFYGGMAIMWRNGEDAYLNLNHTYSNSSTNVATYTSPNGIGRLTLGGGNFQWESYNGSVISGTAYSLTSTFIINKAGNVVVGGTTQGTSLNSSVTVNNASAGNYSGLIPMTANVQRGYYGGTSTGLEIGVSGSGLLDIYTNGVQRMRISSAGVIETRLYQIFGTATSATQYMVLSENQLYRTGGGLLYINNSGSGSIIMAGGGGNIGINTDSPATKLHIRSASAQTDTFGYLQLEYTSSASGNAGLTTKNFYGTGQYMQWENFGLRIGSRILTSSGQGNLYITSGADSVALTILASAASTFASSVTATSFFESSDNRLKTLIDGSAQIAGIENLQAKLYEKNGKLELGYFAQDAQEFMPYSVEKNMDGFLSLSYREVHTAKIARLEQRVSELEKQLNAA